MMLRIFYNWDGKLDIYKLVRLRSIQKSLSLPHYFSILCICFKNCIFLTLRQITLRWFGLISKSSTACCLLLFCLDLYFTFFVVVVDFFFVYLPLFLLSALQLFIYYQLANSSAFQYSYTFNYLINICYVLIVHYFVLKSAK